MKTKQGFTLTEVIIATGILSAFICGLLSLFSTGNKMGNQAMWLQTTTNQLKNTARQINTSIRRSSYPSCMTFPQTIIESDDDSFMVHYRDQSLCATQCAELSSNGLGTKFMTVTESTPAKTGYSSSENHDANLLFHIFYLSKNGDLNYVRHKKTVPAANIVPGYSLAIPEDADAVEYKTNLAKNVESVFCTKTATGTSDINTSLQVTITCTMPHSNTSRSETTVGVPNVGLKAHNSGW